MVVILTVDLDSLALSASSVPVLIAGKVNPISIRFVRHGRFQQLPDGTPGNVSLTRGGVLIAGGLSYSWVKSEVGTTAIYTVTLDCNTTEIAAISWGSSPSFPCLLTVDWTVGDAPFESQPLLLNLLASNFEGDESAPTALPSLKADVSAEWDPTDNVYWITQEKAQQGIRLAANALLLRVSGGYIQWQHAGDASWNDLIAVSSLVGAPGSTGEDGTNGTNGTNGLSVNLQVSDGCIQWQHPGDAFWNNLIEVSSLVGATGPAGSYNQSLNTTDPCSFVSGTFGGIRVNTTSNADHPLVWDMGGSGELSINIGGTKRAALSFDDAFGQVNYYNATSLALMALTDSGEVLLGPYYGNKVMVDGSSTLSGGSWSILNSGVATFIEGSFAYGLTYLYNDGSADIAGGAAHIGSDGSALFTSITLPNATAIKIGAFDNGTGGANGLGLICSVGYELNWQGGRLRSIYQGDSTGTPQMLFLDSPLSIGVQGDYPAFIFNLDGSASLSNSLLTFGADGSVDAADGQATIDAYGNGLFRSMGFLGGGSNALYDDGGLQYGSQAVAMVGSNVSNFVNDMGYITSWGYDQSLNTGDSPSFDRLTLNGSLNIYAGGIAIGWSGYDHYAEIDGSDGSAYFAHNNFLIDASGNFGSYGGLSWITAAGSAGFGAGLGVGFGGSQGNEEIGWQYNAAILTDGSAQFANNVAGVTAAGHLYGANFYSMNQAVGTTSSPTFAGVYLSGGSELHDSSGLKYGSSTVAMQGIGVSHFSNDAGYLTTEYNYFNQLLNTGSSPTFAGLTVGEFTVDAYGNLTLGTGGLTHLNADGSALFSNNSILMEADGNLYTGQNHSGPLSSPAFINLGNSYNSGTSALGSKLFFYTNGTVGSTFAIGVGPTSDMQYHAGSSGKHDFYSDGTLVGEFSIYGLSVVGNTLHTDGSASFANGCATVDMGGNASFAGGMVIASYDDGVNVGDGAAQMLPSGSVCGNEFHTNSGNIQLNNNGSALFSGGQTRMQSDGGFLIGSYGIYDGDALIYLKPDGSAWFANNAFNIGTDGTVQIQYDAISLNGSDGSAWFVGGGIVIGNVVPPDDDITVTNGIQLGSSYIYDDGGYLHLYSGAGSQVSMSGGVLWGSSYAGALNPDGSVIVDIGGNGTLGRSGIGSFIWAGLPGDEAGSLNTDGSASFAGGQSFIGNDGGAGFGNLQIFWDGSVNLGGGSSGVGALTSDGTHLYWMGTMII